MKEVVWQPTFWSDKKWNLTHNCATSCRMNNAIAGDSTHVLYNRSGDPIQNASADFENCLAIPSMLTDYVNTGASVDATKGGKKAYCFHEDYYFDSGAYRCPDCNLWRLPLSVICTKSDFSHIELK